MKITELRPELRNNEVTKRGELVTVANAMGMEYDCPECTRQGGRDHRIWTPFEGRGYGFNTVWKVEGSSLENLSLRPAANSEGKQSVKVISGQCHGHWDFNSGEVYFHPDSAK